MGACNSTSAEELGSRPPADGYAGEGHPHHTPRHRRARPDSNTAQSIIRVGSKVLRPGGRRSDQQLAAYRASTYDHVHNAVLLAFESKGDVLERGAGIVGLRNLGNTCFLNCSLQCLSNTIPLTDYFLGYDYRKEINRANFLGTKGELVTAYASLMKEMWLGTNRPVVPRAFKSKLGRFAPQFQGGGQHDAQELLAFLLDGIHEDLNRVRKRPYVEEKDCDGTNDEGDAVSAWQNYLLRNRSIVVDLFQGQLRSTMVCRNPRKRRKDGTAGCGHLNVRFEPFMYLSLPIAADSATLDECLELFCAEESLTGDDRWYCPKCKDHVNATKKFDLWTTPPILIVHLKRFRYTDSGYRSKINQAVNYPLQNWDLSRAVKCVRGLPPTYDLYAVSNHVGDLGGGHYTAFGMNRFDDCWYEFNDSRCRRINDPEAELGRGSPSAYCLFYNRAEHRPVSASGGAVVKTRNPVVRRQSTDRPELWPQLQRGEAGMTESFRRFQRSAKADLPHGTVVRDLPPQTPVPLTNVKRPMLEEITEDSTGERLGDTSRSIDDTSRSIDGKSRSNYDTPGSINGIKDMPRGVGP